MCPGYARISLSPVYAVQELRERLFRVLVVGKFFSVLEIDLENILTHEGISEMLRAEAQSDNFQKHEMSFSLIIQFGECSVNQWSFGFCGRHGVS